MICISFAFDLLMLLPLSFASPEGILLKSLEIMVLRPGLEPGHLTAYAPQTYVSTNSTT